MDSAILVDETRLLKRQHQLAALTLPEHGVFHVLG
jgi:hypothetical protein